MTTAQEKENQQVDLEKETDSNNNDKVAVEAKTTMSSKRRRLRCQTTVSLPDRTSLFRRRLEQFFFQDPPSTTNSPLVIGKFTLQLVHSQPNIYVIDDFLNASELDYLDTAIAKYQFQSSFVDDSDSHNTGNQTLLDKDHRTSTFLSFNHQHNKTIAKMEQKAATLLGCYTTRNVEGLQLVRYLPGQFFGLHHDTGNYIEDDHRVEVPPKNVLVKRRLVTIFCYLTDTGGPTCFESIQCSVQPKRGRAVLFSNVLANGQADVRTVHAGVASDQIKYGLNIWICEE